MIKFKFDRDGEYIELSCFISTIHKFIEDFVKEDKRDKFVDLIATYPESIKKAKFSLTNDAQNMLTSWRQELKEKPYKAFMVVPTFENLDVSQQEEIRDTGCLKDYFDTTLSENELHLLFSRSFYEHILFEVEASQKIAGSDTHAIPTIFRENTKLSKYFINSQDDSVWKRVSKRLEIPYHILSGKCEVNTAEHEKNQTELAEFNPKDWLSFFSNATNRRLIYEEFNKLDSDTQYLVTEYLASQDFVNSISLVLDSQEIDEVLHKNKYSMLIWDMETAILLSKLSDDNIFDILLANSAHREILEDTVLNWHLWRSAIKQCSNWCNCEKKFKELDKGRNKYLIRVIESSDDNTDKDETNNTNAHLNEEIRLKCGLNLNEDLKEQLYQPRSLYNLVAYAPSLSDEALDLLEKTLNTDNTLFTYNIGTKLRTRKRLCEIVFEAACIRAKKMFNLTNILHDARDNSLPLFDLEQYIKYETPAILAMARHHGHDDYAIGELFRDILKPLSIISDIEKARQGVNTIYTLEMLKHCNSLNIDIAYKYSLIDERFMLIAKGTRDILYFIEMFSDTEDLADKLIVELPWTLSVIKKEFEENIDDIIKTLELSYSQANYFLDEWEDKLRDERLYYKRLLFIIEHRPWLLEQEIMYISYNFRIKQFFEDLEFDALESDFTNWESSAYQFKKAINGDDCGTLIIESLLRAPFDINLMTSDTPEILRLKRLYNKE